MWVNAIFSSDVEPFPLSPHVVEKYCGTPFPICQRKVAALKNHNREQGQINKVKLYLLVIILTPTASGRILIQGPTRHRLRATYRSLVGLDSHQNIQLRFKVEHQYFN